LAIAILPCDEDVDFVALDPVPVQLEGGVPGVAHCDR
jgi:hypothetical protein